MSENDKFIVEREFVKEMSDKRRVRMSLVELQRRLIELGEETSNEQVIKKRTCPRHPTKEARFMVGFVYLCGRCADEQRRQGNEPVRVN